MPRILGLDYGERRLGFALSDSEAFIAMPLSVSHVRDRKEALREVERVVQSSHAERLVIGMPLNMNGSAGFQAENVKAFVEDLVPRLSIPVETWDERLSTCSAEHVLIEAGESRRRRKEVVDKLAAQIMLQSYLDAHPVEPPS
ncbi:MAG TPA: Holliday junction resolvase RuvX [Kiritimatiellia bacterium]|nr:Holliday junction resolvase RuvX [Kiritimatiellia bacterium]